MVIIFAMSFTAFNCTAQFITENYNLNDNQVPSGWIFSITHGTAALANGRLEAYPADGHGRLIRNGYVPSCTDSLIIEWKGVINYSYWGMQEIIELTYNTSTITCSQQYSEWKTSYYNHSFIAIGGSKIAVKNSIPNFSVFNYKIILTEDSLIYMATDSVTGVVEFRHSIDPKLQGSVYDKDSLIQMQFYAQSSIPNMVWLDNPSIKVVSASTFSAISSTGCNQYTSPSGKYTWTASGTYMDTIPNSAGCDSVITVNLVINHSSVPTISGPSSGCAGIEGNHFFTEAGMSDYTWNISAGGTITMGGGTNDVTVTWNTPGQQNITVNYTNGSGCAGDTATKYLVSVNPVYAFSETQAICAGDSVLWQGVYRKTTGIHTATYSTSHGCDSTYSMTLSINPKYVFAETQSICAGDSVLWQGAYRKTAGIHTATYSTSHGCDSTYTMSLSINPKYAFAETQSICDGDSVLWQGAYQKTAGIHTATYSTKYGCDSTYTMTLSINPKYAFAETQSICTGDSLLWQGAYRKTAGIHTANYSTSHSCDSTYTMALSINPKYTFVETQTICAGDSVLWQGAYRKTTGTHTVTYSTKNSCDSTYSLLLTVNPVYSYTENHTICSNESYTWHGNDYNVTGIYHANYYSTFGCDSVYELELTVNTIDVSVTVTDPVISVNTAADGYQWLDCDNEYAAISSATLQSFTASANGQYAVRIAQGSCADTSACVQIVTVGIADENFLNITLYPNPSNSQFTIVLEENANIEIYNTLGSLVYNATLDKGKHLLSLNLSEGVYLLKASNGRGMRSLRLEVQ